MRIKSMSQWMSGPARGAFQAAYQETEANRDSSVLDSQLMGLDLAESTQPVSQRLFL